MIYFLILYLIICLIGFKFEKNDSLSKENTTYLNGIFVGIIFFSHFNSYIDYNNTIYNLIFKLTSQLMVSTFLLFSGYGIMESIEKKDNYIKSFFKNRFVKVYISFLLSIVFYLILNLFIKEDYSLKTYLLSLIGYESIGNSNWYMLLIFYMYLNTILSFKVTNNRKISMIILYILTIIYYISFSYLKNESVWITTCFLYPFGMTISLFKDKFIKIINKFIISLIGSILLFGLTYIIPYNHVVYNFRSLFFVITLLIITSRIKLGNMFLNYLGNNIFEVYILQRISFIVYSKFNLNMYSIFILSIITTILLIKLFKLILNYIYKFIYKKSV